MEDELCSPACSWIYTSTTAISHIGCNQTYKWEVFDNFTNEKLSELDSTSRIFIYSWPYKSEFRIRLTVTDSPCSATCFIEKVFYDEDCFEPCPPTGGGGGAPPYKQEGYKEAPCSVKIKRVYIVDEKTHNVDYIISVKDVWLG
jgi:hypothetical protein